MTLKEYVNKGTVVVHDGIMHADDAFCVAMCQIMLATQYDDNSLCIQFAQNHETAKKFIDDGYLVMDIGLGEFDHHDRENQRYRDEAKEWPMAAFGRVWEKFGAELIHEYSKCMVEKAKLENFVILSDEICEKYSRIFDDEFVRHIDRTDCTGQTAYPNTMSNFISTMNLSFDDRFLRFRKVSEILDSLLFELCMRASSDMEVQELIKIANKDLGFIVLEKHYDGRLFKDSGFKYLVEKEDPRRGDGYTVRSVDSSIYPINYAVSGENGCKFCHPAKFLATFDDLDSAVECIDKNLGRSS